MSRYYYTKSLMWADQWNIRDTEDTHTVPAVAFTEDMAKMICKLLNIAASSSSETDENHHD